VSHTWDLIEQLKNHLQQQIIGQELLVNRLLIALLADGHLLVEGAPGLAKTRAIKALATGIDTSFHRIQFTPDLLPADITGTEIYRPEHGNFEFQAGPIFHNLILADEINRAPAKVQSALLEAMAERQVSIGAVTHRLPELFLVMATQNPIEQEGTYPLPEAQLDRFLLHVQISYPSLQDEHKILLLARQEAKATPSQSLQPIAPEAIFAARQQILSLDMVPAVENYLLHIIMATRDPSVYDKRLAKVVQYGASPRATIALDRSARAHAWLAGRGYVTPDDIQAVAFDVLRHRLCLTFEAESQGMTTQQVIAQLLAVVTAP
jgi:MoxR-like ATPase